jgi:hypothetical protein
MKIGLQVAQELWENSEFRGTSGEWDIQDNRFQ